MIIIIIATVSLYCKKKDYAPPVIKSDNGIAADSVLEGNNLLYGPENLIDKTDRSWCEGANGDGIGSKITIHFVKESKIESLFIKNGFGDPEYFSMNNRVKEIRVRGDIGKCDCTLKDSPEFQEVKLKEPVSGRTIVIEILSVYKGTKYSDTCFTEISFENLKIKPCEKIGDFKSMKVELKVGGFIDLQENGNLGKWTGAQVEPFAGGSWTKDGNKINLSYLMKSWPQGCDGTGMGPDADSEKCKPTEIEFKEVLIIHNSCLVTGSNGMVSRNVEITK